VKKSKALTLAAAASLLALAGPASAVVYTFAAPLTGAAESPPVTTTASGSALVTFDDVALTVSVAEIWIGLLGGPATASHIHCCTAVAGSGNIGVALNFTGFPSATTGIYTNTFTLGATPFSTLLTGALAGKAYVNIHNAGNPGGEIRGFLISPVPEVETYGLMLAGLGVVGFLARRRRV
jgi:hypothetical protein